MPTTVTKTIKSSGGDYTSVTAWEAGVQGDLVAADEIRVGELYDVTPTTSSTIDGSTTDATRYLTLTVAAANRHAGVYTTSKCHWLLTSGFAALLTVSDPYTEIWYLQFRNSGVTSGGQGILVSAAANVLVDSCIGAGCGNDGGGTDSLVATTNSGTETGLRVRNSLAYGYYTGIYIGTGNTGSSVENCVLVANDNAGMKVPAGLAITVRNTYAGGNINRQYDEGGDVVCTNYTFTTSMSSSADTSKSGLTNSIAHSTANFTNVTGGSENYHRTSGSALAGVGTDLSGSFTLDIDGDARSAPWDIGIDQLVSSNKAGRLVSNIPCKSLVGGALA